LNFQNAFNDHTNLQCTGDTKSVLESVGNNAITKKKRAFRAVRLNALWAAEGRGFGKGESAIHGLVRIIGVSEQYRNRYQKSNREETAARIDTGYFGTGNIPVLTTRDHISFRERSRKVADSSISGKVVYLKAAIIYFIHDNTLYSGRRRAALRRAHTRCNLANLSFFHYISSFISLFCLLYLIRYAI